MSWVSIATGGDPSLGVWETLQKRKARQQAEKKAQQEEKRKEAEDAKWRKELLDEFERVKTQSKTSGKIILHIKDTYFNRKTGKREEITFEIPLTLTQELGKNIWRNDKNPNNIYQIEGHEYGWEIYHQTTSCGMVSESWKPIKLNTTEIPGEVCFVEDRRRATRSR
jgi:hypothetical protein